MKTQLIAITIAALLILAGCGTSNGGGDIAAEPIEVKEPAIVKIGVALPLTGDVAFLGESARKGIELGLKEVQTRDTKYNYELVFEDDKMNPKEGATVATKLINVDDANVIISFTSGQGNVIAPIATENKIIHFGIASDANIAKGQYSFIHWTPPDEEARVWVKEAQQREYERLAILTVQQQGNIAIVDSLKEYLKDTDVKIVFEDYFNFGEKDFRTMILKAKNTNPDIILIMAFSPEMELIAKQIKEANINVPITSIEAFELTSQPELFEGQWYVNAADPSEKFLTAFKKDYDATPQMGTANMYDELLLVVEGFERTGKDSAVKPSNEEVAKEIAKIKDFDGALGKLSVNEDGIVWSSAVVRMIKDGKPVTIK